MQPTTPVVAISTAKNASATPQVPTLLRQFLSEWRASNPHASEADVSCITGFVASCEASLADNPIAYLVTNDVGGFVLRRKDGSQVLLGNLSSIGAVNTTGARSVFG